MAARHARADTTSLAELRARIRSLERGGDASPPDGPPVVSLGVPALDGHLPGGGLALAGLHEIAGAREEWDDGAAAGFCLGLLGRIAAGQSEHAPFFWVARRADLYGPGLAAFLAADGLSPHRSGFGRAGGFDPGRLILVRAAREAEVLWAAEEALRAPGLGAVVAEAGEPDTIAARRLQLAAEAAGRPCLLVRRRLHAPRAGSSGPASPALTRWRIAPAPSEDGVGPVGGTPLPGRPAWRVDLLRARGGTPGTFLLEWDDATGGFAVAAPVRGRAPAAGAPVPARLAG